MTIVRRPSPFGELVSLRQAMDRLFEDSFVNPREWAPLFERNALPLDVRVTGDELLIQASLPGVSPENVDITIENGTLTVSGEYRSEQKSDKDQSYIVREIRRGSFSRTVTLPEGIEPDKATASSEHGVLTIRVPRAERAKPHTIRITPTTEGSARPVEQVGAGQASGNGAGAASDAAPARA